MAESEKKCVIFDQDGTLRVREEHYATTFGIIASACGVKFKPDTDHSDLRRRVMGVDWKNLVIPDMITTLKLDITSDEYDRWAKAILNGLAPYSTYMEGAEDLIKHLAQHRIPIAIATSCEEGRIKATWATNPNDYHLFNAVVAGDDKAVEKGKPAPDLLLVAMQRLGFQAQDCVYVGDTKADQLAAEAAGMTFVGIPNYVQGDNTFDSPDFQIKNLDCFPLQELGLPDWVD